jgi:hypothetical protein
VSSGKFQEIELGFKVGGDPPVKEEKQAASPSGKIVATTVNKGPKHEHVYGMAEMADGRVALLQQKGVIRVLELRPEQLASEERWVPRSLRKVINCRLIRGGALS